MRSGYARQTIFGRRLANGKRLSQIDDTNRGDHFHITADDTCFYLYEYTSARNYAFSSTNGLISNLKKKPSQSSRAELRYKAGAIADSARALAGAINPDWLRHGTLVPVPGSKIAGHPDHDDRILKICQQMSQAGCDIRELVIQTTSTDAAHEVAAGQRVTVEQLLAVYRINEAVAEPPPRAIAIVDDVLTAGTHYRAMNRLLSRRFPNVPIVGLFVARRVFPPGDPERDVV